MASPLPTVAWWIFAVLEPFLSVLFFIQVFSDPRGFVESLSHNLEGTPMTSVEQAFAFQLVNMVTILEITKVTVLTFSSDPKAAKALLWSYLGGDIGHIGTVYFAVGHQKFFDYANWNSYLFGNVGVAGVFLVLRFVTLLDGFGLIKPRGTVVEKNKIT